MAEAIVNSTAHGSPLSSDAARMQSAAGLGGAARITGDGR